MLGWLALLIVQPTLVSRRNLVLHRRLGWFGAAHARVIACLGVFIGAMALVLHRQPPFFTPPFFPDLTAFESLVFGAMAACATRRRRGTDCPPGLLTSPRLEVRKTDLAQDSDGCGKRMNARG